MKKKHQKDQRDRWKRPRNAAEKQSGRLQIALVVTIALIGALTILYNS